MVNKSAARIGDTSLWERLYQPARQHPVRLIPGGASVPSPDPHYDWQVPGDEGWFDVKFDEGFPSGYLLLQMRVRSDLRLIRPFMIYGDETGFTPGDCYHPLFSEQGSVSMPFWLPKGCTQIHFRFSKVETCFTVEECSITTISEFHFHWLGYRDHYRRHNEGRLPPLKVILPFIYREMSGVDQELSDSQRQARHNSEYQDYWQRYYQLNAQRREVYLREMEAFSLRPTLSIIMPVFNVAEQWLQKAIQSVQAQFYPHWELCICDDASSAAHIRPLLESFAASDARIKLVFSDSNGHISAASNAALALATGDYLCFLDHDDELAEDALFQVVKTLNANPSLAFIYSDEDLIDERGQHHNPHFKTDWNPFLLHNINYICHLAVYRTEAVRALGGLRLGVEGAQDYDLVLRYTATLADEQIAHIPRVLYHWRAIPGSTAHDVEAKNYAADAGIRALRDLHAELGSGATVEAGPLPTAYRVRYPLPDEPPSIAIIIPTRNCLGLVKTAVNSILSKTEYRNFHIFIVDNESDDERTLAYFASLADNPQVSVLRYEGEFNFSAINNYAVAHACDYDYVALVNNDIEVVSPEWLGEMLSLALQPGVGCVGARLIYADHGIQHGGVVLGLGPDVVAGHSHKGVHMSSLGYAGRLAFVQEYSAVTAACLLVRRALYLELGGLNAEDLKIAYNDVDFCLRVRAAGYRNVWTPYAELYHYESISRGYEITAERRRRFAAEKAYMLAHWQQEIMHDPFYNPNLTRRFENFALAEEPRWRE